MHHLVKIGENISLSALGFLYWIIYLTLEKNWKSNRTQFKMNVWIFFRQFSNKNEINVKLFVVERERGETMMIIYDVGDDATDDTECPQDEVSLFTQ